MSTSQVPRSLTPAPVEGVALSTTFQSGMLLLLPLGIVAALAAWGLEESLYPVAEPPVINAFGRGVMPEEQAMIDRVAKLNAGFVFAALGGMLAVFLAVGEGIARKNVNYAFVGALLASLTGAAAGFTAGCIGENVHAIEISALQGPLAAGSAAAERPAWHPIARAVITHTAVFGLVGLGVGLGFSIATLRPRLIGLGVLGGLLSGIMSAVIFGPLLGALMWIGWPVDKTDFVVPSHPESKLFMFALIAVISAVLLGGIGKPKRSKKVAT